MFLNDWLSRRDLYTPRRVAVVDDADGRQYRYCDLQARAVRVARHLRSSLGVKAGDRVVCLSSNRIEYIDLYFACGKLGAILVPLNYRLPTPGILELLEDCEATVLVVESDFSHVAAAARSAGVVPLFWSIDTDEAGRDQSSLCDVLSTNDGPDSACDFDVHQADESDIAMILYTSGTTGRAKGAMIPYRQIHWNALNTIIGLQLTQDDTAFLNMPLYHTGGWHVLFTPLMLLGGRIVLQTRFDPQRCNDRVGPEGITILFGVPTTLRMMWEADNFSAADFTSVRFAIFGGESCPLPLIEAYGERDVAMRQGYGLTEAGPNCFSLPAEDSFRKQGSIGLPNFHIATRLVNESETGIEEAAVGEVGELWMKGPHTFAGYWNNPTETAHTLRDGWLATGDLMTCDSEGYHYVVGRKKEMYVSGGENVYPAHVERILQSHEAVALAAVIGVPDPKWGETGVAFLTLHDDGTTESELRGWCKQHLATFQCPTRIEIMNELPIGASGKIDKLALAHAARQQQ